MDADLQTPVPDNGESKATFRKPSSDAANRKYRRHSPVGGSSSSDGSLKREHSGSPTSLDDPGRDPEHRSWRDDVKERGRDYGKSLHGKSGDSYRHSDRQSYRSSHGYSRHEDYIRHDKFAYEDRNHERLSSRPVRESRGGTHSDHTRHDSEHGRPKDYTHNVDKYSRDRYDVSGYRSKENVRETSSLEHKKYNKDSSYDRAGSGSRHAHSDKVDRDRRTRDRDGRDGNKDYHRSSGDRKSKQAISYDQSKERWNGSNSRIDGKHCLKEACKSDLMGLGDQKSTREEKKRYDDSEKDKDQHTRETREQIRSEKESPAKKLKLFDERKASSSKQSQEDKVNLVSVQDGGSDADNDLNAAKVAAMKAAELVNRNLVGVGYMTADQKKKLLWGNKKTTTTEESGNRWDTTLFPDRERQEKFNKLMGVKGDMKVEQKPNNQEEKDLRVEKEKELQLDLEKQYTAGLRRRDGRTVGLGL
ncbi:arginine/serine-rich coiled-coil protein 2 isoform X2 [Quillaja saponaria]|uniref:Arginine/serine-rich coiled-coil protein 2 isoform X2 n=1 Tax=Quillaja saponaria TaxID=32244 RepID=A0AAD7VI65_QUISA|nr:arginine/serine-rich coiled-coil protein 2 isoform X2 [Quillaja saponaria]